MDPLGHLGNLIMHPGITVGKGAEFVQLGLGRDLPGVEWRKKR